MRDSFIFYRSFFEATKPLETEQKAALFDAICRYSLDLEEIELDPICSAMFALIKPQLIANINKYKAGKKSALIKQKANRKVTESKQKTNKAITNVNYNVNNNLNKNDNIYRRFNHLSISLNDYENLVNEFGSENVINILDQIENYKGNTKYKSLFLTAKNWLKNDAKRNETKKRASDFDKDRTFGISL